MLLYLQPDSDVPLYQQIRDQVVAGLATGLLSPGDPLPPIRQLAADFGVHFHTVNKAYDLLRQEGLIRLHRRTGAVVVCEPAPPEFRHQWRERARVLLAEAFVKGIPPEEILAECTALLETFHAANAHSDLSGGAST
ncbi:MAG: GntR family transcriptional regulator [Alicyclobacillus macrosporangiidus]|uniref:GntR family transcriptional regulator n=1 Tax=Alicyclobacillus macrosporangiidus TaxID=392015 RepID=UPI0026E95C95|nr:GntR family transcriptional regulator [Alicyclobacillus macrosporangiidus]MCL6600081.1 GntR family transcriptional regulator [Alicyclobacillus macrosporangiidus]